MGFLDYLSMIWRSHNVTEVVKNTGLEFESASAGPDGIVIEEFGQTLLYDLASGKTREVKIRATGDFPEIRPHFEKLDSKKFFMLRFRRAGRVPFLRRTEKSSLFLRKKATFAI